LLRRVPGFRVDRVSGRFKNGLTNPGDGVNEHGLIPQPKINAVWTASDAISANAHWGRSFQVGVGAASVKIPPRTSNL
jgi:iron complex outermembrane recepter protein